eukprot:scaffold153992_cov27-Cyclotella_meneghiniana.AAC.1
MALAKGCNDMVPEGRKSDWGESPSKKKLVGDSGARTYVLQELFQRMQRAEEAGRVCRNSVSNIERSSDCVF